MILLMTMAIPTLCRLAIRETWDDLAWENLVNSKAELDSYHITFNKNIVIQNPANQPLWNSNAADIAAILFQDPVLFARHAAEMLPEN